MTSSFNHSQVDKLESLLDRWENATAKGLAFDPEAECQGDAILLQRFKQETEALKSTDWLDNQSNCPSDLVFPFQSGNEILPGYCLHKQIGKGSFGIVWSAIGPGGVRVALKCLWLGQENAGTEWKGLKFLRDLRHPNLLGFFGFWLIKGWLVAGCELATGSLADLFNAAKEDNRLGLQPAEILQFLRDAASGLDYLHNLKEPLIHGDIKPANLLVVGGRCKLGDFGLVRAVGYKFPLLDGGITIGYAAPELFFGKPDINSDQYSLAITYSYLRGCQPLKAPSGEFCQVSQKQKPDLAQLSHQEAKIISKALAIDPSNRFANCSQLVNNIEKAVLGNKFYFTNRNIGAKIAITFAFVAIALSVSAVLALSR
jgi:serine/threonine protein kinase